MNQPLDVVIVGGGPAGLSAALILGLSRRRVLVIDDGQPRNAPAPVSHGFLTRDGVPPAEISQTARDQLANYPHVECIRGRVSGAKQEGRRLVVQTAAGASYSARRLILATGLSDQLPPLPGLAECWGKSIFPCPYCHAWEYRDQPLGFIANNPGVWHTVAVLRSWSANVALLTNGPPRIDYPERMRLHTAKVPLYDQTIVGFEHDRGHLARVIFGNGTVLSRKALLFHPPATQTNDLPIRLGLIVNGQFQINPATGQTSNPLIYVAGDMAGIFTPSILTSAVHGGSFTGRHVNQDLAAEDFTA